MSHKKSKLNRIITICTIVIITELIITTVFLINAIPVHKNSDTYSNNEAKLEHINEEYESMRESVSIFTNDFDELTKQKTELEAELAIQESKQAELSEEIAALNELDAANLSLSEKEAKLKELNDAKATLQSQIDSGNAQISSLKSQLDSL